MNSFETFFWPALFVAVLLVIVPFIARERKKTGIKDEKAPFRRLLLTAVIMTTVTLVLLPIIIAYGLVTPYKSSTPVRDFLFICGLLLAACLGVAAAIYVIQKFFEARRRSAKTLRRSMALSFLYTLPLIAIFLFGGESLDRILLSLLLGVLLGLVPGAIMVRRWKRNIVRDRIIFSRPFVQAQSFKESLVYWKDALLITAGAGAGIGIVFYLTKLELLRSVDLEGVFFGEVIGVCLYGLIWAYLYEKRTGIRLRIEYGDSNQSADSPVA